MDEILLPDCQFRRLSDGATCRDIHAGTLCQACTAHVQVAALRSRLESVEAESRQAFEDHQDVCAVVINLRTRLESTEATRREAQESRFAVIIENEELGAELADLRARLESAEAALRFYANEDNWFPGVGINRGLPCSVEADEGKRARAALAAANEGNTG